MDPNPAQDLDWGSDTERDKKVEEVLDSLKKLAKDIADASGIIEDALENAGLKSEFVHIQILREHMSYFECWLRRYIAERKIVQVVKWDEEREKRLRGEEAVLARLDRFEADNVIAKLGKERKELEKKLEKEEEAAVEDEQFRTEKMEWLNGQVNELKDTVVQYSNRIETLKTNMKKHQEILTNLRRKFSFLQQLHGVESSGSQEVDRPED